MDYEKEYNNALERAKQAIEDCGDNQGRKNMIYDIFPELAESEDEKIRKSLLAYIKGESNRLDTKKWIAYLEKQKDAEIEIEKAYKNADKIQYKKGFEDGVASVKSAEWDEEDTYILGDAITAVDLLGNDNEYSEKHPNLAKAFRVAKDWLKSLPERFELHPKQEWSEEDETCLEDALWCVLLAKHFTPKYVCDTDTYTSAEKWLKSLPKRLKSLRPQPHWKPSEEQMEWLESAVKLSTNKPHIHGIIISLYEQLKRL